MTYSLSLNISQAFVLTFPLSFACNVFPSPHCLPWFLNSSTPSSDPLVEAQWSLLPLKFFIVHIVYTAYCPVTIPGMQMVGIPIMGCQHLSIYCESRQVWWRKGQGTWIFISIRTGHKMKFKRMESGCRVTKENECSSGVSTHYLIYLWKESLLSAQFCRWENGLNLKHQIQDSVPRLAASRMKI